MYRVGSRLKLKIMLVVTSKAFRDRQGSYLDEVDNGMEILIHRGKNRVYKIVPVPEDETLMRKEDFFAKIDKSLEEARQGKVTRAHTKEELMAFLDRL